MIHLCARESTKNYLASNVLRNYIRYYWLVHLGLPEVFEVVLSKNQINDAQVLFR